MSNSIDERIVQIQFDNKKFEDGVADSLKTLEKLKKATDFKASTKSFTDLESAAKALSFRNLEAGVKSLTDRFSTLGIVGMTALQNITNKAIDAGERLVKSLTIDQVTTGWDKYADKTSAVQTIMAATAKDFDDTGKQMEYVNEQLDKLNWFTDETSYHFLDMVSNIGKFTSKGIDLKTSVTAMQGIANWAAISGANANDATRAMNNLSQALGMGAVKVQDWQSIESVNMDTFEFKEIVLETAVALGTLEKTADGAYKTIGKKGKQVTNATFRNTLADGWFTSDVLIKSLDRYGAFTDKLYEATEKTGATATEFLGWIEDYQNGTIDLTKIAKSTRTSVEELDAMLSELSSDTYDLGRRSLQAGQEAKTFGEAIGSVKEAVSTGWMNTFEIIFGDYMEAKELWTDLSEGLFSVFASGGEERNLLLRQWRAIERVVEDTGKGLIVYEDGAKAIGTLGAEVQTLDGRTFLIEGVTNALQALVNVGSAVKYAFQSIFPPMTASRLFDLTVGFRDFTAKIKDALHFVHELTSEEVRDGNQVTILHDEILEMSKPMDILVRTLRGVFAAGKIVVDVFKSIGKAVFGALTSNMSVFGTIGEFIASIGDTIVEFKNHLESTDWYNTALGSMSAIFSTIGSAVQSALTRLQQFGSFIRDKLSESGIFTKIQEQFSKFSSAISSRLPGVISRIGEFFSGVLDWVEESDIVQKGLAKLGEAFDWISGVAVDAWNWGSKFFTDLWTYVQNNETIQEWFSKASDTVRGFGSAISDFVRSAANAISSFFKRDNINGEDAVESLEDQLSPFEKVSNWFKDIFENMRTNWSNISDWFTDISSQIRTAFSNFFGTVGGAFEGFKDKTGNLNLGSIFWSVVKGLGALAGIKFLHNFSNIGKNLEKGLKSIGNGLKLFGKGEIQKKESIGTTFLKIAGSIALVAAAVGVLTTIDPERLQQAFEIVKTIGLGMAGIMTVLGIVNSLTKNGVSKIGNSILQMGLGLLALTGSVWLLSKIDWNSFQDGLDKLAAVLTELALFEILVGRFGKGGSAGTDYLKLGAGVLILVASLKWLSTTPWDRMWRGAIGLGLVLGELAFALRIMTGKGFSGFNASPNLLKIGFSVLLLVAGFKWIASTSWEDLGKGILGFTVVIGEISLMILALKALSKDANLGKQLGSLGVALAGLYGGFYIFTEFAKAMKDFDGIDLLAKVGAFDAAMVAIAGAIALFGSLGIDTTLEGGLGLAAIETIALAMGSLIGTIERMTGGEFSANLDAFGSVMESLGGAIGKFFGGIAGGVLQGVSDALPTIGSNLSEFFTNADPFLSGISKIGADATEGINNFKTLLTTLGSGTVKKGISNLESLTSFGENISTFGENIVSFAESISGLSEDSVTKTDTMSGIISSLATSIPDEGFFEKLGWVKSNVSLFGSDLETLGGNIVSFAGSISDIDDGAISKAEAMGGILASLNENIPEQDFFTKLGLLKSNVSLFGSDLTTLGTGLSNYASSISGLSSEAVEESITALGILNTFQGDINPSGGLWSWLTGKKDLGTFGNNLTSFGNGIKEFGEGISVTNVENISSLLTELNSLLDLADRFSTMSYSDKALWDFTDGLSEISETGFANFIAGLSDSDGEVIAAGTDLATNFLTAFDEAFSDISSKGESVIKEYISGISSQGSSLVTIANAIGSTTVSQIESSSSGTYQIGYNAITGFLQGLSSRMNEVKTLANQIGEVTKDGMKKALDEHSPSRETYEIADLGIIGYVNALHDGLSAVSSASEDIGNQTILSIEDALSQLGALIENDMDVRPTITPVFDMTNLGEATDQLDNAFYMNRSINLSQAGAFARNAEAVSDLNFKMGSGINNSGVIDAINNLGGRVDALNDAMANMKLVLDTGATVGGLASSMDRALGQRASYKGRGN